MAEDSTTDRTQEQGSPIWRFFTTLPGILTALATLLTAVVALVAAIRVNDKPDTTPATASTPAPSGPVAATAPRQAWITIKGVSLLGAGPDTRLRVVIFVGAQAYSYPSRAVWVGVGPEMSEESFPLPVGGDSYQLSFQLLVTGHSASLFMSQQVLDVPAASLPYQGQYQLYAVESGATGTSRAPTPGGVVRFEVHAGR